MMNLLFVVVASQHWIDSKSSFKQLKLLTLDTIILSYYHNSYVKGCSVFATGILQMLFVHASKMGYDLKIFMQFFAPDLCTHM